MKILLVDDHVIVRSGLLNLLTSIAPAGRDLAIEYMLMPEKFEDAGLDEPYDRLLSARYAELSEAEKSTVLAWMRKGPLFLATRPISCPSAFRCLRTENQSWFSGSATASSMPKPSASLNFAIAWAGLSAETEVNAAAWSATR